MSYRWFHKAKDLSLKLDLIVTIKFIDHQTGLWQLGLSKWKWSWRLGYKTISFELDNSPNSDRRLLYHGRNDWFTISI